MFGLKTCFALSRQSLDKSPVCPDTNYRPVEDPPGAMSASQTLAGLDDQLDDLLREWTQTLLSNLDDDHTVAANIELISDAEGKNELEAFIKERALPDPISSAFIKALQEALMGLEKVAVTDGELHDALTAGGIPCTIEELKSRFDVYVAKLTKGKDAKKTRVVVE